MSKLICVIGVTGNQGGSVAERFLKDTNYRVRGLTRNPTSERAQQLAAQSIEIVKAELDDVQSLENAFAEADLIFSGISCARYAYDVEYQQGKNIADAAATVVDCLESNGFLVSTLSHAGECSKGIFNDAYHFDSEADVFPKYVNEKYPALAAKMSCIQTGYFMTSYKLLPLGWLAKQPDNTLLVSLTSTPHSSVSFLGVNADTGNFVYAVAQMPPGQHYMVEGESCDCSEYARIWSEVMGQKVVYKQITDDELVAISPDPDFGREITVMFNYPSDPGYDGGTHLVKAEDIRKAGIDCPMTSLRDFVSREDWSAVLGR